MTKWEQLNLKLQLVNLNLEVGHYFIDYDANGKPVLYWTSDKLIQEVAHGIESIDAKLASIFEIGLVKMDCIVRFLKGRIF